MIDLEGMVVAREPKFLSENLVIFPSAGKGAKYLFVFPRSTGALVEEIVEYLRGRLSAAPTTTAEVPAPEREPVLQA